MNRVSLAQLSEDVLATVEKADRVKTAEAEAVRGATPRYRTEVGQLLHKVAEDLRAAPVDLTYDDLSAFMSGSLS